jgi:cytochrome c553
MAKKSLLLLSAVIVFLAFAAIALPAQTEKAESVKAAPQVEAAKITPQYVGAAKCKLCHKAQYDSWLGTMHAKAFDALAPDGGKNKPECVKCHVTGTTEKAEVLEGVQCEACHGPGSEYKSPKIMSKKDWGTDPAKYLKMATDAGLVIPTEAVCKRCHTPEGNPNFKPFDYAKMKSKVHVMPEAETKAATEKK